MVVKVNIGNKRARNRAKRASRAPAAANTQAVTRLGAALRSMGTIGGGALGGYFGNPAGGAAIGNSLGGALSRWLGSGDYTVGTNSIVNRALKSTDSIPMMHRDGQSIIVRHKEYLGEVKGSTDFTVFNSYELNPGNAQTFPWLSGVAKQFQEYKFKGLVFHYIPSSGNAVSTTNAALGTVMMQTSYRSNDAMPNSKLEMLNEYCSSESVPSEGFCHPIECDPKENPFNIQYVRTTKVPEGDSKLLYDLGITHLAVSGQQADGNTLGDLWVTYEVELKKPIIQSNVTSTISALMVAYADPTISSTTWFVGTGTRRGNLDVVGSGRTLTFPRGLVGRYVIMIVFQAVTNFTAFDITGTPTVQNCAITTLYPGRDTFTGTAVGGTGLLIPRSFVAVEIVIAVPEVQASITFAAPAALVGTLQSVNLVITPFEMWPQ